MNYQITYCTLAEGAYKPERAYEDDAGADLRTPERVVIHDHDRAIVDTGVAVAIPVGYFGWVAEKSGLASKGIAVTGGIIDSSYRGRIRVILENNTGAPYIFEAGDKIAQLIIVPCVPCQFTEVSSLDEGKTGRGTNGFGSTGRR